MSRAVCVESRIELNRIQPGLGNEKQAYTYLYSILKFHSLSVSAFSHADTSFSYLFISLYLYVRWQVPTLHQIFQRQP